MQFNLERNSVAQLQLMWLTKNMFMKYNHIGLTSRHCFMRNSLPPEYCMSQPYHLVMHRIKRLKVENQLSGL